MGHTQPVTGQPRTEEEIWDTATDGDFRVNTDGSYILCVCPCGCGGFMNLPIATGPKQVRKWQWNGDRERPTLEPSIRDLSGCKWHGYLKDGVWTPCGDSGR